MNSCKNWILITLFLTSFVAISQQVISKEDGLVSSSLVFAPQAKHVHSSSIVDLPNGDFLVVWFYGSGERNSDDVQLMGARLRKGETKWSEPFPMADTPNIPDCNPVLFLNQDKKLFLVWIAVQANKWEQSILRYKTTMDYLKPGAPNWTWQDNILLKPSDDFAKEVVNKFKEQPDEGKGWSEYAPKYDEMIIEASEDITKRSIGWMTRIKPLVMENGRIVLPLYSDGYNMSMMAISDDKGTTWRPSLPLVGRGPIQPALVQKKNKNLVAFLRDSGDYPPRVHYSESSDLGESWSMSVKTDIPNTASVEILALADGRWAFIGNDMPDGRNRLVLFLSDDEGKTWKWKTSLENVEPNAGGFSYPSLIQTSDGLLHITYSHHLPNDNKSIKYVVINPAKISIK
ncbi:sialidase family protein [Arcticibacterium luteifluviistationis]|uniref:Neuraminidase n=1 Tax=Arcticibacterium luteifluviistationis TaxID=1784714 RepID=A0A2Z4GBJ5_9BACT|nr:sialidase family protein [Arcticibacterium luteifluviistationis]AWV98504.1 neuraminidase [Arcticibacterium luteifluviistationis]